MKKKIIISVVGWLINVHQDKRIDDNKMQKRSEEDHLF